MKNGQEKEKRLLFEKFQKRERKKRLREKERKEEIERERKRKKRERKRKKEKVVMNEKIVYKCALRLLEDSKLYNSQLKQKMRKLN